jgi:hypothetical protein
VFAASLLLLSIGIHQGIVERVFGDAGWFHWFSLLVPPGVLLLWLLMQAQRWRMTDGRWHGEVAPPSRAED